MPSKQVTDNQKSTAFVVSSATANRDAVARGFAAEFGKKGHEKDAEAAMKLVIELVADKMASATADLVAKDDALQRELGDDTAILEKRDAALATTYELLTSLRETARTALGQAGHDGLGFKAGPTPRDAGELQRLGRQVEESLKTMAPTPTRIRNYTFKPADYTADVKKATDGLEAASAAVLSDLRENQAARATRDTAAVANAALFSRGAGVLSALLRLAGLDALADRLRPSGRSPGTVDDPEVPAPAGPG